MMLKWNKYFCVELYADLSYLVDRSRRQKSDIHLSSWLNEQTNNPYECWATVTAAHGIHSIPFFKTFLPDELYDRFVNEGVDLLIAHLILIINSGLSDTRAFNMSDGSGLLNRRVVVT